MIKYNIIIFIFILILILLKYIAIHKDYFSDEFKLLKSNKSKSLLYDKYTFSEDSSEKIYEQMKYDKLIIPENLVVKGPKGGTHNKILITNPGGICVNDKCLNYSILKNIKNMIQLKKSVDDQNQNQIKNGLYTTQVQENARQGYHSISLYNEEDPLKKQQLVCNNEGIFCKSVK